MVLERSGYGFNGYQVPTIPRSSRSARGRGLFKKKVEHNHMSAFELLATVAGKLFHESEKCCTHSNASAGKTQPAIVKGTIKQEQEDKEKLLKVGHCDPGSCDEGAFGSRGHNQNFTSKEFPNVQNDAGLEPTSIIANSDFSEKVGCAEFNIGKNRNEFRKFPNRMEEGSPGYGDSCKGKPVDGIERKLESEQQKITSVANGTAPDTCSSECPMELDSKPPAIVSSDSSVDVPMRRDHIPRSSFPGFQDNLKVTSKDDDENSSGCSQPSTIAVKSSRPPSRIGDRRIRKILASKYWKVAPKLKDEELSNTDMSPVFCNRKHCFTRQRSQRNSPLKRRKRFEHSSRSTSEGGIRSEAISNLPNKGINGNTTGSGQTSSSVAGQELSFHSRDSHVKLSIKSLRVPELFIEIPESATVGSLKRTVMEAVTDIIGGGLRVGVFLRGKKVRDDNKSLLQTGISCDDKLDTLSFTLEPNPATAPHSLCHEHPPLLVPCDKSQLLTRYLTTPDLDPGSSVASPSPRVNNVSNFIESNHDSVSSPTDIIADRTTSDSRALVAIPANMEALAVVPFHKKSKRSEIAQRRIRRPFSVSEVEALVHAVEKLGTGRWRDVKLRAFDNAKHRTYVDLKDKWKTLVHTARISPQQRRGEPVPQELLDRVLSAHAYWSQQQAKQQVVQHQTEMCLLLDSC